MRNNDEESSRLFRYCRCIFSYTTDHLNVSITNGDTVLICMYI